MAVLKIAGEDRCITQGGEVAAYLSACGIEYERWPARRALTDDAPAAEVLDAYAAEVEELKRRGGYVTADVIDVRPETPGLEEMLARFRREHWHDEDEVRFVVAGRGLFHIRPERGPVVSVEVEAGDLIRVPRGTRHWFDLCADRRIRAIRLFQDPAGWAPHYTGSGADAAHLPACLGPAHIPPAAEP